MDRVQARLIELLGKARRVVAITGAGVSAESGIPTFRGEDGIWRTHMPEELASPEGFAKDPWLVWEWYQMRRRKMAEAEPNPAHKWLAAFESDHPSSFVLITQNVDGLHRVAGSRNLIEIHGSVWRLRCTVCGVEGEDRRLTLPPLPRCDVCGGVLRPGVVWFGESLPADALESTYEALEDCDLLLVLGTSGLVQPVCNFPKMVAWRAPVVEINPDATPISPLATLCVRAPAGQFLGALGHPG